MLYQCTRCGKEFSSDESLSFCPFCGSPYAAAQPEHQVITQRVVIGTDGERAVQEKYWKATQNVLDRMMQNLRYSLPRFSQERPDCDEEPKAPKELSEKKLDIVRFVIWVIGFIAYRLLMKVDIPCGNTFPDMAITFVLMLIVGKIVGSAKKGQDRI